MVFVPRWETTIKQIPLVFGGRLSSEAVSVSRLAQEFLQSDGRILEQHLLAYAEQAGDFYYADFYRSAFLKPRGALPTDSSTQTIAFTQKIEGTLAHLDLPHRCGALVAALHQLRQEKSSELENLRTVHRARERLACLTMTRVICPESDELHPLRLNSRHFILSIYGRLYKIDFADDDDGRSVPVATVASTVARSVNTIISDGSIGNEPNLLPALTVSMKDEAVAVRRECLRRPSLTASIEAIESAICFLSVDDRKTLDPILLNRQTLMGHGWDRWYGQLNLILYETPIVGFLVDHALTDGAGALRLQSEILMAAESIALSMTDEPAAANVIKQLSAPEDDSLTSLEASAMRHQAVTSQMIFSTEAVEVCDSLKNLSVSSLLQLALMYAGHLMFDDVKDAYLAVNVAPLHGGRVAGVRASPPRCSQLIRRWASRGRVPEAALVHSALREWSRLQSYAVAGRGFHMQLRLLHWLSEQTRIGRSFFDNPSIRDFMSSPPLVSTGLMRASSDVRPYAFPAEADSLSVACLLFRDDTDRKVMSLSSMSSTDPSKHIGVLATAVRDLLPVMAYDSIQEN